MFKITNPFQVQGGLYYVISLEKKYGSSGSKIDQEIN